MFRDENLQSHMETSSTIQTKSAIVAEWNLNLADNIEKIGNYRFRPLAGVSDKYGILSDSYDSEDQGYLYTDATDASIVIDGLYDDDDVVTLLKTKKEKEESLFSLESCFERFRPRSGINKARYGINTKNLHHSNSDMALRPRYYMPDKNDKFKYWSSFRSEPIYKYGESEGQPILGAEPRFLDHSGASADAQLFGYRERGVSSQKSNQRFYIDDAAPFIVYQNRVPSNRIVVKLQTNVGSVESSGANQSFLRSSDPLFGSENQTTPVKWKIQYLDGTSWSDAISFDENSSRADGTEIIKNDGYVEIFYGLLIPDLFKENFVYVGEVSSVSLLPETASEGEAFLVKSSSNALGEYYVRSLGEFSSFVPQYGWQLYEENSVAYHSLISRLVDPDSYIEATGEIQFREFQYIRGIRIVAETMNRSDCSLDVIEISPRLAVDLADMTKAFSITKTASDLGISGLPVGQLLASVGTLEIFDSEQAFNPNNESSILSSFNTQNIQIKFYEIIENVDGVDYFIPIKTMYADGFPELSSADRSVSIPLRDMLFYFESISAPELMIPNVSLSYAISLLLDYVGFSNYTFFRTLGESDPVIPFFFTDSQMTLAEVLQQLAISTQTAMFFDEYNNFVTMSKDYIMPTEEQRATDLTLYGSKDFQKDGIVKNLTVSNALSNIAELVSQDNQIFNDGKISFDLKYIQKSIGSIKQAFVLDKERRWTYKPVLLWEVAASQRSKSINGQNEASEAYSLSAIPLNSNITTNLPRVVNNEVVDNVLDLGEAIYWLGRYNGYLYANGEIIKFDAVEYVVTGIGEVWITSNNDYQEYFSKIPFNGKMYPTGRVRIFSEPNYEIIENISRPENGPVAKHGRGQFGTSVVEHFAGMNPYWKAPETIRGYSMESRYLFASSDFEAPLVPSAIAGELVAGIPSNTKAKRSTRTDVIKNFLSSSYYTETPTVDQSPETVQASALVFEGPSFTTEESPVNFVSYVTKKISDDESLYRHFGTRMRVIGKVEADKTNWQSPAGATTIYNIASSNPEDVARIDASGGGIGVLVNPSTNTGYYFEILAANNPNLESYDGYGISVHNLFFYKVVKTNTDAGLAAPVKLWSGLSNILVDDGAFTGQERVFAQEFQTVYDLAVEYENVGSSRRFYLFLNGTQIATVDDFEPSAEDEHDNIALFVRGASRCMFENLYAIRNNYSKNASTAVEPVISKAFGSNQISINESLNKYSISGLIQSTYLSGISPADAPQYNIYYEEFGTIMREAAYFNIKYDKAFPALYSKISPTLNKSRGYTVSGFYGGAYGAEFLLFNATDTTIVLDEKSGNYLRIQGITFTQNSPIELTVDEFFNNKASLSKNVGRDNIVQSPLVEKKKYQDIKLSRMTHGKKEFELSADYIQDYDSANSLMQWLSSKIMRPRLSVGLRIFANPAIQLGDIVNIDYSSDSVNAVSSIDKRFVVYNIEYSKDSNGPQMSIYLSEV
jgi:hypothetical protein